MHQTAVGVMICPSDNTECTAEVPLEADEAHGSSERPGVPSSQDQAAERGPLTSDASRAAVREFLGITGA